ncbi:class I SAM-dependent methyltransferase [Candidatus Nitrosotenuis cloacae]|uniref:class I SAM-dependent methyltransferase n=1 Tax=Candidatus Nitrosotenuis cloacae TaxID=1603555 RepID=UPI002281E483|nr:class I SAM-dependent methyltransferase [Candidatus Nitrosotenuis cloacae]
MDIEELFDKISPHIPEKIFPDFINMICWYEEQQDKQKMPTLGFTNIPPPNLRFHVTGRPFLDFFLRSGNTTVCNLEQALEQIEKNFNLFENVLEFGCGCGRLTVWLEKYLKSKNFYGTDIDVEAISWCKNNLKFGTFDVNDALPPLKYQSDMFDLIYSYSVFTHLDEEHQFAWLAELKRITKSNGIVMLTIRGEEDHEKQCWSEGDKAELKEHGFLFRHSNLWSGFFPSWYQTAFHTKEYVMNNFSKYFDVLKYIPKGSKRIGQDIVILRKQ